ncbi:C40 family peptidase, partial [Arthrobacter sp. IA7]|uniref:C40 family peptidase n=1 Tax=Arthrobacter ipis TaxID=2716202 RepID=UPI001681EE5A
ARPAPALAQPAPGRPAPAPAPAPAPVQPAPVQPAPSPGGSNQAAISVAMGKVGSPYFYQYGGTGAYGFDCSGLVQNAFAAIGKQLPRTAAEQFAQAPVHVPLSQAQPGDLLVWGSAPGFYHVAIYLGGGKVVQALNPSAGITVTELSMMAGMQLHPVAARY